MSVYKQQFLAQLAPCQNDVACGHCLYPSNREHPMSQHRYVCAVLQKYGPIPHQRSTLVHTCIGCTPHHRLCTSTVRQDVANMKGRISFPPNHFRISFLRDTKLTSRHHCRQRLCGNKSGYSVGNNVVLAYAGAVSACICQSWNCWRQNQQHCT